MEVSLVKYTIPVTACLAVVSFLHYVAANFSKVQFHNHTKCVPAKKNVSATILTLIVH